MWIRTPFGNVICALESLRHPRSARDLIHAAVAVLLGTLLLSNTTAIWAQEVSSSPGTLKKLSAEDIRRSGATSLPEALRLASNLEVAQIDARQWAISARGFNSTTANKLLVLIDGRTVYTPLYAGVFWDVQDTLLEDIDRIEVI